MPLFEELDYRRTPLGELVLRRRRIAGLDEDIYEVKLDDDLLMSSLLTASERALADLALHAIRGKGLDVLVGGLGLGYTAAAALAHGSVGSVTVVEVLPEVVEWHRKGLVPLGTDVVDDPRTRVVEGDFFRLIDSGLDGDFDAVLVDIDHSPESWLHPSHGGFYGGEGLAGAASRIRSGGVFGFWSSGRESADFTTLLADVFPEVAAHEIEVLNPLVGEEQVDTIYIARVAG